MKLTKSTHFIFPMLNVPYRKFPGFINCYIKKSSNNLMNINTIQVLCKGLWSGDGNKYISDLNLNHNFKLLIHIKKIKNSYTLLTFMVPNKYLADYYKFLQGKYSEFSEEYKKQISKYFPKFVEENGKRRLHNNFAILYPKEEHRKNLEHRLGAYLNDKAEIYSAPDLKEEILNTEFILGNK